MRTTRHSLVVVGFCVVVSFNVDSQNQIWILLQLLHSWAISIVPGVFSSGSGLVLFSMVMSPSRAPWGYHAHCREQPASSSPGGGEIMPFLDSLTNWVLLFLRFANTSVVVMNFWAITKKSYKSNKEKKLTNPMLPPPQILAILWPQGPIRCPGSCLPLAAAGECSPHILHPHQSCVLWPPSMP